MTNEITLGEMLGEDLLWAMAEFHFFDCAARYERGEPTLLTDDEWDRLGYGLQQHPERWSRWFKDRVPWTPGIIEKPTRVGLKLGKASNGVGGRQGEKPDNLTRAVLLEADDELAPISGRR